LKESIHLIAGHTNTGIKDAELTRQIKMLTDLPVTPKVILITAVGHERVLAKADHTDLDGFLSKPVCASRLFDTILDVFGFKDAHPLPSGIEKGEIGKKLQTISGARVLLVEDNEINQQLARELLITADLEVIVANNGSEALHMVSEQKFDVVLMDIQMPLMDGYEASRRIRKEERFKSLPIIAMTAHALAGDREKCLDAGMNDHVSKPIAPEILFSALLNWIEPQQQNVSNIPDEKEMIRQTNYSHFGEIEGFGELEGISVKTGLDRTMGNTVLYRELLSKFYRNHAGVAKDLETMVDREDFEAAVRLAHNIKGVAGNIGAQKLQEQAETLENSIRKRQVVNFKNDLVLFSKTLEKILLSLKSLKHEQIREGDTSDEVSMDYQKIISLVDELEKLLKEDDTSSNQVFSMIRQAISSTFKIETFEIEGMTDLEKQIADYAFDKALDCLPGIKVKLNALSKGKNNAG